MKTSNIYEKHECVGRCMHLRLYTSLVAHLGPDGKMLTNQEQNCLNWCVAMVTSNVESDDPLPMFHGECRLWRLKLCESCFVSLVWLSSITMHIFCRVMLFGGFFDGCFCNSLRILWRWRNSILCWRCLGSADRVKAVWEFFMARISIKGNSNLMSSLFIRKLCVHIIESIIKLKTKIH